MKGIARVGMLCFAGVALFGCAADSDLDNGQDLDSLRTAHAELVQLRFVHGSPTSGEFDVYLGTSATPLFTAVAFGAATPYAAVPPAGIQLVLRTAGAAATDAPVYTSDVFAANAGDTITSIAGGLLTSTAASSKFRVLPYTEAFAQTTREHAAVRFVHDSFGVATAGFDVGADGTIEAAGVAPFTGSDAAGVEISARRDVQLAIDTGSPATKLTSFTLPEAVLAQRGGIFIAVVGVPSFVPSDNRGLAILAVGRRTATLIRQNPSVYVLPAIPDVASVDLFAIGRELPVVGFGTNVAFGALAPALQVAPTERGIELLVARSGGAPLAFQSTGPLVAGERYLAIASGFADRRSRVRLTIEHDGFDRTIGANGLLRGVAASPDAPAVDIGQFPAGTGTAFTPITGLAAIAYRQASAEIGAAVNSGQPLNPGVRVTGTDTALRFAFGAITATDRAFGVFAGAFAPAGSDAPAQFIVIKAPATGAWTAATRSPL